MPKPPAVWHVPHSDDGVLSMSTDILNHIDSGRDVIVVLATLGCSQYMLDVLNGKTTTYEGTTHNPVLENYHLSPLDRVDIEIMRQNEFKSEVGAYRLYANGRVNVTYSVAGLNEGLSVEDAKDIILRKEYTYPGSSHKVMTYYDSHLDHRNMGLAAKELKEQGKISDVRYYIKHDDRARISKLVNVMINKPTPAQKAAVERATRPFRAWSPASGSYAFGLHSVAPTFNAVIANPDCYVHV